MDIGLKLYKLQPSSDTKTENYSLKRFIKVFIHRDVATKKKKIKEVDQTKQQAALGRGGRGPRLRVAPSSFLPSLNKITQGLGGWVGGSALTIWAIDDARAVGDDEYKTGNDEG